MVSGKNAIQSSSIPTIGRKDRDGLPEGDDGSHPMTSSRATSPHSSALIPDPAGVDDRLPKYTGPTSVLSLALLDHNS